MGAHVRQHPVMQSHEKGEGTADARRIHFDLGRQSSHLQEPGKDKGTMREDMLLEVEQQIQKKGKSGSHLVGGLL